MIVKFVNIIKGFNLLKENFPTTINLGDLNQIYNCLNIKIHLEGD